MRFSLMTYTVAPSQPGGLQTLEEMADFASELEFEALELSAGNLGGRSAQEFGALCRDRGLAVSCINGGADLAAADEAGFRAGLEQARRYLEMASTLDCPVIMLIPGRAASPQDKPRATARIAEGLRQILPQAENAGVAVTIEDFPNLLSPYASIQEVRYLLGRAPGLKLTFDNGNFLIAGDDPLEALRAFADYVVNVHVKDWEPDPEQRRICCADGSWVRGGLHGQGMIDHRAIFAELVRMGYDGYLAFEYEGVMDHVEATRRGMTYLREVLAEVG